MAARYAATPPNPGGRRSAAPQLRFDQRLVLNRWILSLLGCDGFNRLAERLNDPSREGYDEDNTSRFYPLLRLSPRLDRQLTADQLLAYDRNIVRHWRAITERRARTIGPLYPKYFQYVALLFAEIYLDRYFANPSRLLSDLNSYLVTFNGGKLAPDQLPPYDLSQLNKVAYWSATGSGKTLLMHVNLRQYQHYLGRSGRRSELDHVILLTPTEGLSQQHLREFELSGIQAELFEKEGRGLFAGHAVEVIDINKLRDDMGERTVAIDAFEGTNLVLVDEGHRGASGLEWMAKRNQLCQQGFSFEYSATLGQAMKAANKPALTQEYAKCILFDYSYKYFYGDGYGKDYRILNLEDDKQEDTRRLYLTACLLVFYQQARLYSDKRSDFAPYLIEPPLWVFVGSSVNAVRTERGRPVSDVLDVLLFLDDFVHQRDRSLRDLDLLITARDGLRDSTGRHVFAGAFDYLVTQQVHAQALFEDILKTVFNATAPMALHLDNLTSTDGEIALRLGDNRPFGVINVGDPSAICKLWEGRGRSTTTDKSFAGSLFHTINDVGSPIKLLLGSKKFQEGWNSWRVSTMGLMNVGRSEGSQVIQLFGRGVRLKGHDFSLKRSGRIHEERDIRPPGHLETLETLEVFGVRADYMRQFRDYLAEEGAPDNTRRVDFVLPVLKNLGAAKLRVLRLKEGVDFRKTGPKPTLDLSTEALKRRPVVLDWYPRIQAERSRGLVADLPEARRHEAKLSPDHLAFIDMDELFFDLQRYKDERCWHNLNIPRDVIPRLLASPDWYTLYIPYPELTFTDFRRVRLWHEIASTLLRKYCDRYYRQRRNEYEQDNFEYHELTDDDLDQVEHYRFLLSQADEAFLTQLKELKRRIESRDLRDLEYGILRGILFSQHLYQPLVYLQRSTAIQIQPVSLNEGERDFVVALSAFYQNNPAFFDDRELYLLRNPSRGRGIGFFDEGGFYPDFILWLVLGGKQYITFIDPKGVDHLHGFDDPKIRLHKRIKDYERRLGDPDVVLNSFILSVTPFHQIPWRPAAAGVARFEENHVLLQHDRRESYIRTMLDRIVQRPPALDAAVK